VIPLEEVGDGYSAGKTKGDKDYYPGRSG